jgi:hypothetical protein
MKTEIEKCIEDPVYFVENYTTPKIKLMEWQKELFREVAKGNQVIIQRGRQYGYKLLINKLPDYFNFKLTKKLSIKNEEKSN